MFQRQVSASSAFLDHDVVCADCHQNSAIHLSVGAKCDQRFSRIFGLYQALSES